MIDAGADATVNAQGQATLSGSGSDLDGDPITYQWVQVSGPATATIQNDTTLNPTVSMPRQTTTTVYDFQLTATDGTATVTDTVRVTVPGNTPPVADAGTGQTVAGLSTYPLDGRASSDVDNNPLTYLWSQVSGPAVTISNVNDALTNFTTPATPTTNQTLVFSLQVSDGIATDQDTVTFSFPANQPPVVTISPDQTVTEGQLVTLTGTASDPETDPLTLQFTQTAGAAVTLSNPASTQTTFTAPAKTNVLQTLTFDFSATDTANNTSTATSNVFVTANIAPVADAGPNQNVSENAAVTLTAAGSSDADDTNLTYSWTQTGGAPVTLTNANTISPTFIAPPKTNNVQSLTFEVTVSDGLVSATDAVTVDVAANAGPTASAGLGQTIAGGTSGVLDGSASSDPDGDALLYQWSQVTGPTVSITNATSATAGFTAPAKTNLVQTLEFELSTSDGLLSDTDRVVFTVPANVGPTADAGATQTVDGATPVTLNGSGSVDGDGDMLTYVWTQVSGPAVTLTGANTAAPTFTAPAKTNAQQSIVFELTVSDGNLTSTDQVTVDVRANQAPTADAGTDQTTGGSALVTLNASGSVDPDGDTLTINWVQLSGPTVALSNTTSRTPSFTAPPRTNAVQTLVFEVTVSDGVAAPVSDTVTILVAPNTAPLAEAGPDQTVVPNSPVTLDGSNSMDADNDPLAYSWTQVSGPAVTLTGANSVNPGFTAPQKTGSAQTLVFELTVDDGTSTATDQVTITVPANSAPIADAGADQTVAGLTATTLDGNNSSDPDGDPLSYQWVQTSGPAVTLNGANMAQTSFTAPAKTASAQTLIFDLTVSDGVASATDSVTVTITPNAAPVADAGTDITVDGGDAVALDASGSSDPEGDPLTYSWVQVSGTTVTLAGANSATPSFTAPPKAATNQVLVFEVTASDGVAGTTDTVTVTVSPNTAPIASAGADQTVNGDEVVTLDASGSSDPDNDTLTYSWTQTSGPAVTLSAATTAMPSFTAPPKTGAAQTLTFQVAVNDGTTTITDDVTITVSPNSAPIANAGALQTVSGLSVVTLDGTGSSDPDGDTLTYSWAQLSGPSVTLSDATVAAPTFTAPTGMPTNQNLTFELTVSDGAVSSRSRVTVIVSPNLAPTASAGADQGPIDSGQTVTLDGTGSSDPDGDPLTYQWTQISGTTVSLSDPAAASPNFVAPLVNGTENLVFQLVVNDGQVNSVPDQVTIAIQAIGTITIVQRVVGADRTIAYTSDVAALNTSVTTINGEARLNASAIPSGTYSFAIEDLRSDGYALTELSCDDTDSVADLANQSVAIDLSPGEDLICNATLTDSREPASQAIRGFLAGRNTLLLSTQPNVQRRLSRLRGSSGQAGSANAYGLPLPGSGGLPVAMSLSAGKTRMQTSLDMVQASRGRKVKDGRDVDVWADVTIADSRFDNNQGEFKIAYFGIDKRVSDTVLLGGLVQFDDFDRDGGMDDPGAVSGNGWMAGPYVTAKLSKRLYADARIAYGQSDNKVSPFGTYVDTFKTNRLLVNGSLIGELPLSSQTTLWPEVSLRYLKEDQKAYEDSLSIMIPEQTVDQGEFAFSPRFDTEVSVGRNRIRPFAQVEGILTFGVEDISVLENGVRARINLGADIRTNSGLNFTLSGFHDGIGADAFEASGVQITLSKGF
ncbi:MAG: PKD domain-containing protein [Pseudomonadota bacterium]